MSKSKRTQERHRKQNKDQTSLTDRFGFTRVTAVKVSPTGADTFSTRATGTQSTSAPQITVMSESALPPSGSRARSASVLSNPSTDAGDQEEEDQSGLADVQEDVGGLGEIDVLAEGLDDEEIYESDLEEAIQGPKHTVKDWSKLRKQIKTYLGKHSKSLPLTKLNQYLIIIKQHRAVSERAMVAMEDVNTQI
jgi:hypothetical protein